MNYGYWLSNMDDIETANKNLCDLIYNEIMDKDNILDIGCGYGEQDFYWKELGAKNITAIDISKKSIKKGIIC